MQKIKINTFTKSIKSRYIKILVIAILILVSIVIVDIKTPFGGNLLFYSKWIQCGERPYRKTGLPGAGLQAYEKAPIILPWRGMGQDYYCTALEAEKDGLSSDPHVFSFPELEKEENRNQNH